MVLDHDTGLYNVEATLMAWLNERLIANRPPLVSVVVLSMVTPQEAINCPMWSAHFAGYFDSPAGYQGRNVDSAKHGMRRHGLLEISCWVSRQDANWRAQLAQMQDAITYSVAELGATGSTIIIKDFYASASAPANTAYKINVGEVEVRQPPVDPNPDIERKRVLISFYWVERK